MTLSEQQAEQLTKSLERERTLARIIDRIRRTLNPDQIFATTVEELRHDLQCDRVVIYRFNADYTGEFVAESVSAGWESLLRQPDSAVVGETLNQDRCFVKKLQANVEEILVDTYLHDTQGGRYRQGTQYTCVDDIYEPGFDDCYVNLLEQFQARAYIMAAIFQGEVLWGLLGIYQNSGPRPWQAAEVNIAVQVGNQMAIAIQQSELLAQVQQTSYELKLAMQAVQSANQAKTDFLANMSHELRTPLNVILGATQVMNRDTALSPVQKDNLQTILRNGEHLLSLINQVLDLSKIEAGHIVLDEASVDVFDLVNTVQTMMQGRAYSKGLEFTVAISPDVPQYLVADAKKLRQVVINLLGNAIKFTRQGAIELRVSVLANHLSPLLCLAVKDTGMGISPEHQMLIFEAFEQTETGRLTSGGTGLGLTISREFVELMGGKISLQSTLGKGTTFTILLPLQVADPVTLPVGDRPILGLAPNQPTYRILVVDDLADSRKVLTRLLSAIGFDVAEASNGQEAVTQWETWHPHLILMDIRMPVMNGHRATHQIRQREHAALQSVEGTQALDSTKIVAFTASAFMEDRDQAIAAGYDDFISKPVSETHLLNRIAQHLNVVYQYETVIDQTAGCPPVRSLQALLSRMSQDWLIQLHDAANLCDDTRIERLLHATPSLSPELESLIQTYIRSFNFDPVIEAAQLALDALSSDNEIQQP